MFLTKIVHDFGFTIDVVMDEVLNTLEFKKTKFNISSHFYRLKISFHSNQGRSVYLLWSRGLLSSVNYYTLVIENIIEFSWKQNTKIITYKGLNHATDELVHYWLLHTFLPLYYTIENIYDMLHVGAVDINGKACLFAAPSFGGKSTLTHFFLQKGHELLSDDKLALFKRDDAYYAVPSYPFTRNYRKLEDLGKYTQEFSTRSLPIGCIYRLIQVGPEEDISIKQVKGNDKFSVIEMSSDIKLSILKQKKFPQLHHLAQKLRIYEITVPQKFKRLEEVYNKISEHFYLVGD